MWVTLHHPPFISRIAATQTAFAAVLGDGTVFTWGDPDKGGDHRTLEVQGCIYSLKITTSLHLQNGCLGKP